MVPQLLPPYHRFGPEKTNVSCSQEKWDKGKEIVDTLYKQLVENHAVVVGYKLVGKGRLISGPSKSYVPCLLRLFQRDLSYDGVLAMWKG